MGNAAARLAGEQDPDLQEIGRAFHRSESLGTSFATRTLGSCAALVTEIRIETEDHCELTRHAATNLFLHTTAESPLAHFGDRADGRVCRRSKRDVGAAFSHW